MSGGRVLCVPRALILTRLTVLVGNRHTTANGIPTSRVLVDAPESQPAAGLRGRSNTSTNLPGPKVTARATPFKATGHKGGISRQGN